MENNIYSTPKANLENEIRLDIPEDVLKKIKHAWIAGLVSVSITIIFTLVSMSGTDILGLDAWAFLDAFLMLVLAFGIYKKSRTCAILMFLLFALNKALMWYEAGTPSGLLLALVFFWLYAQGIVGTFQYHALRKEMLNKFKNEDASKAGTNAV